MNITRRQAIVTVSAAPFMASQVLAAARGRAVSQGAPGGQPSASPGPEPDTQFAPPPLPPTDEELSLLGRAVEAARHASVSELVRDSRFLSLHPQPVFRQLVKAIAREPVLTIPRDDEPGTRIIATGAIEDPSGRPVAAAVVYVYHTSAKGWYSDKGAHIRAMAGDTLHARLFGYLRTGVDGSFEIRTIRPGGYPRSTLPEHIHLEVEADGYAPRVTELLFEDDPRLTAEQRDRAKREGFIAAASSPGPERKPTFRYRVVLKKS